MLTDICQFFSGISEMSIIGLTRVKRLIDIARPKLGLARSAATMRKQFHM